MAPSSKRPRFYMPGEPVARRFLPAKRIRRDSDTAVLKIGPGLWYTAPDHVSPIATGEIRMDRKKGMAWIDHKTGRYIPAPGDRVIGIVIRSAADTFFVRLANHGPVAILPHLAFEGANRRTRPMLKPGALVYARVASTGVNLDTELACVASDAIGARADGLGPLGSAGLLFSVSAGMGRRLLMPRSVRDGRLAVLDELEAAGLAFETVVGRNGRVWVHGSAAAVKAEDGKMMRHNQRLALATEAVVRRAIIETDRGLLAEKEQRRLVRQLVAKLMGQGPDPGRNSTDPAKGDHANKARIPAGWNQAIRATRRGGPGKTGQEARPVEGWEEAKNARSRRGIGRGRGSAIVAAERGGTKRGRRSGTTLHERGGTKRGRGAGAADQERGAKRGRVGGATGREKGAKRGQGSGTTDQGREASRGQGPGTTGQAGGAGTTNPAGGAESGQVSGTTDQGANDNKGRDPGTADQKGDHARGRDSEAPDREGDHEKGRRSGTTDQTGRDSGTAVKEEGAAESGQHSGTTNPDGGIKRGRDSVTADEEGSTKRGRGSGNMANDRGIQRGRGSGRASSHQGIKRTGPDFIGHENVIHRGVRTAANTSQNLVGKIERDREAGNAGREQQEVTRPGPDPGSTGSDRGDHWGRRSITSTSGGTSSGRGSGPTDQESGVQWGQESGRALPEIGVGRGRGYGTTDQLGGVQRGQQSERAGSSRETMGGRGSRTTDQEGGVQSGQEPRRGYPQGPGPDTDLSRPGEVRRIGPDGRIFRLGIDPWPPGGFGRPSRPFKWYRPSGGRSAE